MADLITHRFPLDEARRAYELVGDRTETHLGIAFTYPEKVEDGPVTLRPRRRSPAPGIGLIGAGAFARSVLVPSLRLAGPDRLVSITSASSARPGASATTSGSSGRSRAPTR